MDLASQIEPRKLPYAEDRQNVDIGMTPSFSSDPTCIKFNSVIINIVQRNLDKQLSIQALDLWNDYLEQDDKLRTDFMPTPEMFMQMNLRSLLINVIKDGQPGFDLDNDQNQCVLDFCSFLIDKFGDRIQPSSFFMDDQSVSELESYIARQKKN